jgi:LCP family protein required for cell wall assembly
MKFNMNLNKYFTRQNIIFALILISVFLIGFTTTYFTLKFSKISVGKPLSSAEPLASQPPEVNFPQAPEVSKEKGVYNTVLLGYGGAGHDGSLLTDSIIIIHVNTNNKTAALISVPRDLYVQGNHKINADAAANGFQNEGGVIKNVTGLPTDYFVAVDFGGFVKLIDDLGGISVNNPKTFDDPFYPIAGLENEACGKTEDEINALKAKYSGTNLEIQFTCRFEHLHYEAGPVNLDGTAALKFARSRHGDSDFGRSARQFAILKGVLAKLISLHALDKTNKTLDTLVKIVRTNLDITGIRSLIDVIGLTEGYKVTDIHLSLDNVLKEGTANGSYILVPKAGMFDFSELKSYIAGQL